MNSATEDSYYGYGFEASDSGAITVSYSDFAKPSWLSFNPSTGLLSEYLNDDVGEHWVTLRTTDTTGKITDQTLKQVNANDLPEIKSSPITTISKDKIIVIHLVMTPIWR